MARHVQHVGKELARLRLVGKLLLIKETAKVLYLFVRQREHLGRGNAVVQAMVARGVVEEHVLDIQRVAYIHLCRIFHYDVRQYAACRVAFQGVTFLLLCVVDGLYAPPRGQVVLRGRYFQVPVVGNRAHILHQPLAEGALSDEGGAFQVLQTAAHNLACRGGVLIHQHH